MTQRSKTQLDTLFADNTSGLITPSRLRDFVESAIHSHGSFYITGAVATPIATPGTFVKVAGSTALVAANRATMPVDNRLTYTGAVTVHAHIVVNISTLSAGNNQNLQFAVAKNGVVLPHSVMEHKVSTGSDIKIMTIHSDANLAPGDYLELWCTNLTSTASITAQRAYMYFMGLLCDDAVDC